MIVVIVPQDGVVVIDGVGHTGIDCSSLSDFHAVRWDGTNGAIEYPNVDGNPVRLPTKFDASATTLIAEINALVVIAQTPPPTPPPPTPDPRAQGFLADTNRQDLLTRLQTATAAQISNYVDTNVVDLPSARLLLKKILLVLAR